VFGRDMDWVPLTDVNVGTVSSFTNQLHRPFENISFLVRKTRIDIKEVKIFHFELVRPVGCNGKEYKLIEHTHTYTYIYAVYTLNILERITSLSYSRSYEFDPRPRGRLSGLRLSVGTLSPFRKILECYHIIKTEHNRLIPYPS
jgi:hypothetical protein